MVYKVGRKEEIENLVAKNTYLLGKWLWRSPIERDSLWHAVIRSKYGYHENGWNAKPVLSGSTRSPWKDISSGLPNFSRCFQLKIGNGERVRFWEYHWVGDQPSRQSFPRLLRIPKITQHANSKFCFFNQLSSELEYCFLKKSK